MRRVSRQLRRKGSRIADFIPPKPSSSNSSPTPPSNSSSSRDIATGAISLFGGTLLLAGAGYTYHHWYKQDVLNKMRDAFEPGYDPFLELTRPAEDSKKILRREQDEIDLVMHGKLDKQYLLILGPKGSGKTSMITHSMLQNSADGVAVVEISPDLEVVKLRLGKALSFEYSEDSFSGLFGKKDPREGGVSLDVERALFKLEKVAIKYRKERNRPIVLVFNNCHFLQDDDPSYALLLQLQQRAETWSEHGICTVVFISDNVETYLNLRKSSTARMKVLSISDLNKTEVKQLFQKSLKNVKDETIDLVFSKIGGRLSYLTRVIAEAHKNEEMVEEICDRMINKEKEWLLHLVGLIPDHDDDVMDEQKVAACTHLLFQELARLGGESTDPHITWGDARVIMTRPDYIVHPLDSRHVITICPNFHIRPDSVLMLNVFRVICSEEGFQEKLESVQNRIDAIESLHRTNELTVKSGDVDLGGFLRVRAYNRDEAALEAQEKEEEEAAVEEIIEVEKVEISKEGMEKKRALLREDNVAHRPDSRYV